jgi:hypothetical protein
MKPVRAYAEKTKVTVEKSRIELDALLGKNGAKQRGIAVDEAVNRAIVMFTLNDRRYKLEIPLPFPPTGNAATVRLLRRHAQESRSRWRAMVMLLRAKFESIRLDISTPEDEFLSALVLPNGETAGQAVGQYMTQLIKAGYQGPMMLPAHRAEGPRR